ncbi:hypothetical protein QBC44DRAFT_64046 [Cladorrhinum sp. PSN332]|nr:hypothetical protein QBC44DRAFT_64046 [Cladorrhinum sp. PSN332]
MQVRRQNEILMTEIVNTVVSAQTTPPETSTTTPPLPPTSTLPPTNPIPTDLPTGLIVETRTISAGVTTVPLTTTFTPPAFCHSSNNYFIAIDPSVVSVDDSPIRVCYPSGYRSAVYSPGVCPSGFQSLGAPPAGTVSGEYRALCCRDNLTINTTPGNYRCESTWTRTNEIITYMSYDHIRSSYVTISGIVDSSTVGHTPVEIRWRDGDFASSTTHPGRNPGDGSSVNTEMKVDDSGSLSNGAKAGIGIGIAIATILLLLVAFLLWRRRRARPAPAGAELGGGEVFQLHGNDIKPKELDAMTNMRHEADTNAPCELDARSPHDGSGTPELEATPHRWGGSGTEQTTAIEAKKGAYNASFSYDGLPSWSSTSPIDTPRFDQDVRSGNNGALPATSGAPGGEGQAQPPGGSNNESDGSTPSTQPVDSALTAGSGDAANQDGEIERRLRQLEEEEARIKAQKRSLLDLRSK